MAVTKKISPITRINGFWNIEITVDNGKIVDAKSSGIYFRGLELILIGRDPRDAAYLTQRICGICSSVHALAASLALEDALGIEVPPNGILMRNLTFGADLLQNHIRHFYLLGIADWVEGPDFPPFVPRYRRDFRLSKKDNERIFKHYMEHFEYARKCHEMVTLVSGKVPHQHGIVPGGHTVRPTMDMIYKFSSMLHEVSEFISNKLIPDMETIAENYSDYYKLGVGVKNLMAFGNFQIPKMRDKWVVPFGIVRRGKIEPVDLTKIKEYVTFSWYLDKEPTHPDRGSTVPEADKNVAYSWCKAPRYEDEPVEVGPLAHMWMTGEYRHGISTMDRLMARYLELKMAAELMKQWVKELNPDLPVYQPYEIPGGEHIGVGLTGAMRGALGHWVRVENKRISHYQIITPSAWNCSPRDGTGTYGPIEQALIGTPVEDIHQPIEVGRIARAFDPCLACAVHMVNPQGEIKQFVI